MIVSWCRAIYTAMYVLQQCSLIPLAERIDDSWMKSRPLHFDVKVLQMILWCLTIVASHRKKCSDKS